MNSTFRLKNHLLLAALAAAYPVLGHTAAAARVEFATGNVQAVSAAGPRPLNRGSELNAGETINTGDGRVQLRFTDGAMMSLQPQTEFRIDDYSYSGKSDGKEKGFFSLLRGGLRTITGYIGKGSRDAYKVTTSVATIGIRGTEWTGVLVPAVNPSDVELQLGTGEGAIEVCNGAGCIVVASGESAVVTGNTQPRRTDSRPSLPPSTTTNQPNPTPAYTEGDQKTADGQSLIIEENSPSKTPPPPPPPPKGFQSGSGYVVAMASRDSDYGYGSTTVHDNVNAVFKPNPSFQLVKSDAGSQRYEIVGEDIIGAGDETGTIGWGTWAKGTTTYSGESTYNLDKVHFVVGKPTLASELTGAALGGMTGTYKVVGHAMSSTLTNDSKQMGLTANLTAHFGTGTSVDLDMSVKAGTRTYSSSIDGMEVNGAKFSGYDGSVSGGSGSTTNSVSGFFAGSKASHAGLTFSINESYGETQYHVTNGAIGFKQDTLKTTEPRFTSGGGYTVAMVGANDLTEGGYSALGVKENVTATFGRDSKLTQATVTATGGSPGYGADHPYSAPTTVTAGKLLMDGKDPVLGWGKWTGGTAFYESSHALVDAHYIVGKATPLAEFQQMSGSYTYNKVGNTTPTSQVAGGATLNSASLNVDFGGSAAPTTVALNVNVTAGGRNYVGGGSGSTYSSTFSGYGYVDRTGSISNSLEFNGMFAGKNAKHAGVTFKITDNQDSKTTRGAIGFSKGAAP